MFNLIVSGHVADSGTGRFRTPRDRFLEYTAATIKGQLATLSVEAVNFLRACPSLLIQEGTSDEAAFLVRLNEIVFVERAEVSFSTSEIVCLPPLTNRTLWQMRDELGIDGFEFHRNHWSLKEGDLLDALATKGVIPDRDGLGRLGQIPLPAPSREELLQAKMAVADWSHTALDDFLLEAGVPDLRAGREAGGRRDRANVILEFILGNSGAVTAENHLFSHFFVTKSGTRRLPATAVAPLPNTPVQPTVPRLQETNESPDATTRSPNRVFVVHGRNDVALSQVVEVLGRVGLQAIVLHEQPNMGRHLLTKLIEEADLVTFAVVIMSDDDLGGTSRETLRPRARQNVILELGYFLARLSQKRVCALVSPDLETPSDFDGIVYIRMDAGRRWEQELIRELRAADMPVRQV